FAILFFMIGVIQDIYLKSGIFSPDSHDITTQLTLVGTIYQGLSNVGVLICNFLYDRLGARKLTILGAFLVFGGFMLTGIATSVWHIYLSLSVASSIGGAIMYGVSLRCIPQWFVKKRATAFGIPASSGALGGLVFPFIITKVYSTLGHHWIFYVLGFISLATSTIAVVFLKDQLGQKNKQVVKNKKTKNFDLSVLKQNDMVLWMINGPLALSGRLVVFIFLPSYGTHVGMSGTQVATVTSIAAGSQFFGRICLGIIGDWIGHMNMYIVSMGISSLSIFVMWMLANSFASLAGFSVIFGFFSGAYILVNPPIAVSIVGMDKYPCAINFSMIINLLVIAIPAITSSVGTANNGSNDPFLPYKITGGTLYGVCVLLTLILKFRRNPKIFAKI
ncbi:major facilitator superfamily domain-containing protein, partial [Phascolomyces articulosus]